MAEPRDHAVRRPAVAGMFYPASPVECRQIAQGFLQPASWGDAQPDIRVGAQLTDSPRSNFPRGAIVPHAGWVCSGAVAGQAISALAVARPEVDLVVVFGAIHTPIPVEAGVFDSHLRWSVPGGDSEIAVSIQAQLIAGAARFAIDERFHEREHAVEVELPLIQLAWPGVAILPIEMPPIVAAVDLGIAVAEEISRAGLSAVYLASSDLTHYGPAYGFTPAGVGEDALGWALENDRRILQVVTDMTAERIVPEARANFNSCGPGAIAATMAACQYDGARSATVLRHTNSYQTLAQIAPQLPVDAVGYAGVLIG
jgi:AmmeMemoRadiSam system protein B